MDEYGSEDRRVIERWLNRLPEKRTELNKPLHATFEASSDPLERKSGIDDSEDGVMISGHPLTPAELIGGLGIIRSPDNNDLPTEAGNLTPYLSNIEDIVSGARPCLPAGEWISQVVGQAHTLTPSDVYHEKHHYEEDAAIAAMDIWEAARSNTRDGDGWETWNKTVNYELLKVAGVNDRRTHTAPYKTETSLIDKRWGPTLNYLTSLESKFIDFALGPARMLQDEMSKVTELCNAKGIPWVSPCVMEPSTDNNPAVVPVTAVMVAVKGDNDLADPLLQMCVWALGQFKLWGALAENLAGKRHYTPMISVRGPDWYLSVLERYEGEGGYMKLYGEFKIGDVSDLWDMYKVLGVLRQLYFWADEQHRPWWRETIMGLPRFPGGPGPGPG